MTIFSFPKRLAPERGPQGPLWPLIKIFWQKHCNKEFPLPPGWDANPSQGNTPSIKLTDTHLHVYTWMERNIVRVKCHAQEHNTVSLARSPFLEGPEKFLHLESHYSKISNLMITELFFCFIHKFLHVLSKEAPFIQKGFRHILSFSIFRYRLTKNGLRRLERVFSCTRARNLHTP